MQIIYSDIYMSIDRRLSLLIWVFRCLDEIRLTTSTPRSNAMWSMASVSETLLCVSPSIECCICVYSNECCFGCSQSYWRINDYSSSTINCFNLSLGLSDSICLNRYFVILRRFLHRSESTNQTTKSNRMNAFVNVIRWWTST
jgi:hypothetical protein